MNGFVLVVDDDELLAGDFAHILERAGYQTAVASSVQEAMTAVERHFPDVILMDLFLPDGNGVETLAKIKARYRQIELIVITAHGSIRSAVKSTHSGAFDYLTKPVEPDAILLTVENALKKKAKDEELYHLRNNCSGYNVNDAQSAPPYPSAAIRRTTALARRAALRQGNVLLLGESGTGKDYWARWIHQSSPRRNGPFFSINCAALSREIAESELFGHEPGAFTGTRGRKRGLLELASGGTLLLNEVGELDAALQAKLLTFLDTKCFLRVGGEKSISVDARIIAATNRDLEAEANEGRFRTDLYYRLNVFTLELSPLRDRMDDLPILIEENLERLAKEMQFQPTPTITTDAMKALSLYTWPGNIRELRNVLERAMMICDGAALTLSDLRLPREQEKCLRLEVPMSQGKNLHEITKEVTRHLIDNAIARTNSKTAAAKMLGISRDALNYQLKALDKRA